MIDFSKAAREWQDSIGLSTYALYRAGHGPRNVAGEGDWVNRLDNRGTPIWRPPVYDDPDPECARPL